MCFSCVCSCQHAQLGMQELLLGPLWAWYLQVTCSSKAVHGHSKMVAMVDFWSILWEGKWGPGLSVWGGEVVNMLPKWHPWFSCYSLYSLDHDKLCIWLFGVLFFLIFFAVLIWQRFPLVHVNILVFNCTLLIRVLLLMPFWCGTTILCFASIWLSMSLLLASWGCRSLWILSSSTCWFSGLCSIPTMGLMGFLSPFLGRGCGRPGK